MDGAWRDSDRGLVRILVAGSVDDGKSTLIGRLLLDSGALLDDERQVMDAAARTRGQDGPDLAALTDGLSAERAQGITIDVAWRHFVTPARRFLFADVPGHTQYTRNMVTAASVTDVALVLLDAGAGVTDQTRRHLAIAILLGVRSIVVAINKMDAVGYGREPFEGLRRAIEAFCSVIDPSVTVRSVPVSALRGDNVVRRGRTMAWYDGPTLLGALEGCEGAADMPYPPFRFPVQLVRRPPSAGPGPGRRRYLGRIEAGRIAVGDPVAVMPAGVRTHIAAIRGLDGALSAAAAPESVALDLADQVDVVRGDMIAAKPVPHVTDRIDAVLVWLGPRPLDPQRTYVMRHGTRMLRAVAPTLHHALDISTGTRVPATGGLAVNGIAVARLRLEAAIAVDPYRSVRATGSLVLIDPQDESTVAAGLVLPGEPT